MTKETLNDKIKQHDSIACDKYFDEEDAKEKIQNAQRRLKDELKVHERINPLIVKRVDKIFLEEFGEELI